MSDGNERSTVVDEAHATGANPHLTGKMFFVVKLAKLGYSVSVTMGNARAVDPFAAHKDGVAFTYPIGPAAPTRCASFSPASQPPASPAPLASRRPLSRIPRR